MMFDMLYNLADASVSFWDVASVQIIKITV